MAEPGNESPVLGFFAELRRRRVIRVVVFYAIAGWVVIEVASTMLPGLRLPDWSVTLVIALVVLGFPIAVLMGWMFDIGPRGVQRTTETIDGPLAASPAPALAPAPGPGAEQGVAVAPRAVPAPVPREPSVSDEGRRTIAVLPFVNMSGDAENEYFSDGISEEILNLLTKLPQLKVSSRTSSFNLKGEKVDIKTVARQLGVGTILEGSVRRAGDRVRITAQLIEADSDSHLWSETYDREMKDVFAIQDDIAQSIVKAMQVTLSPHERRTMQNVATSDAKAYDYYLRGRSYMYSHARRDYEHAIHMFERAIELDPQYAMAHAGMAEAYSRLYSYIDATADNLAQANRASERALSLDPYSAEAHAARGIALLFTGGRYDEARQEFESAVALNPQRFETYFEYGQACASNGDFDKAAQLYVKAAELNPADYLAPVYLAQVYASLGRKQEEMRLRLAALEIIEQHLELNPHDTRALYIGAQDLWRVGEHEKATKLAEQALNQDQNEPIVLYNIACFYAVQGDKQRAIELLEKAVALGWNDPAWLATDSDFDTLHSEPRFQALLARVH